MLSLIEGDRRLVLGPDDTRRLMDMPRSGAREANAGDVTMSSLAVEMRNCIATSTTLQRTSMPVTLASGPAAGTARRKRRRLLSKPARKFET